MTDKVLSGLAPYELLMLAITMVGVLYLCLKDSGLKVSREGMYTSGAGLRFDVVDDAGNRARSRPEGFAGSQNTPPEFPSNVLDPADLDLAAALVDEEDSGAGVQGTKYLAPVTVTDDKGNVRTVKFQEGMYASGKRLRSGFTSDKLVGALAGH